MTSSNGSNLADHIHSLTALGQLQNSLSSILSAAAAAAARLERRGFGGKLTKETKSKLVFSSQTCSDVSRNSSDFAETDIQLWQLPSFANFYLPYSFTLSHTHSRALPHSHYARIWSGGLFQRRHFRVKFCHIWVLTKTDFSSFDSLSIDSCFEGKRKKDKFLLQGSKSLRWKMEEAFFKKVFLCRFFFFFLAKSFGFRVDFFIRDHRNQVYCFIHYFFSLSLSK